MTRTRILLLVGLATLVVILGATFYVLHRSRTSAASTTASQASTTAPIAGAAPAAFIPRTPPQGWKEYDNTAYHFSLFYPDDLSLDDHVQPDGEHTAVFDDPAGNKGFQVFIVPYSGTQITQSRFSSMTPAASCKTRPT
jgi:hypothetical protein